MFRYVLFVILLLIGAVTFLYFRVGTRVVFEDSVSVKQSPHIYKKPNQPIDAITVVAFYFIPKNKVYMYKANWENALRDALNKLSEFHELQLHGRSHINSIIFQDPVIGLNDSLFYDSEDTNMGNPYAVRTVALELEQRVFDESGDLHESLPDFEGNVYTVWYIMYEGVGAVSSENVSLLSSSFLTDPQYSVYGTTYFAHEFYHTLEVPEGYEASNSLVFTDDIMGLGRLRPIDKTFLKQDTLHGLGL